MKMKWVTLSYYDSQIQGWKTSMVLDRELKKELAWRMYLGYEYFRIVNHY